MNRKNTMEQIWITEPARQCPVIDHADVLVVGGGVGGVGAAVAAARQGARVVLVEAYGCLGGMLSLGLITSCCGGVDISGNKRLIGGIWKELVDRMTAMGGCIPGNRLQEHGKYFPLDKTRYEKDPQITPFDPECVKLACDQLVQEANVQVYLCSYFSDVVYQDGKPVGIIIENKSGRKAILAKRFVDSSGDLSLARAMGAEIRGGGEEVGQLTLEFRVGGVREVLPSYQTDIPDLPNRTVNFMPGVRTGEIRAEMTRYDGNPRDSIDITQSYVTCRAQATQLVEYLRKNWPGCENAYLMDTASMMGSLVLPRIYGRKTVTQQDILENRVPEDRIALNAFGIDIADPEDPSRFILHLLEPGEYYGISYGCIVPQDVDNLLIGGRCASAEDDAASAGLCSAISMALGEAAGTAAALSVKQNTCPANLDVKLLQTVLVNNGALLEPEEIQD